MSLKIYGMTYPLRYSFVTLELIWRANHLFGLGIVEKSLNRWCQIDLGLSQQEWLWRLCGLQRRSEDGTFTKVLAIGMSRGTGSIENEDRYIQLLDMGIAILQI